MNDPWEKIVGETHMGADKDPIALAHSLRRDWCPVRQPYRSSDLIQRTSGFWYQPLPAVSPGYAINLVYEAWVLP
jgi:hypothetical protein